MRWLKLGAAAMVFLVIGGCGQPRSRVHGIVRYQGKPLISGTIVFLAPDNQAYPVKIQSDGSYQIASVPRGHVLVGIQAERPRPTSRPQPGSKAADGFAKAEVKLDDAGPKGRTRPQPATPPAAIPPEYADPNHSGLSFDLESSEQEYSIDLKGPIGRTGSRP
jgi:hypothetical protein